LRAFSDASGAMWKTSVKDVAGEVLCVSQFTLLANTSKGTKPDFHRAMVRPSELVCLVLQTHGQSAESSRQLYDVFLDKMKQLYVPDRIKGRLKRFDTM
jgi:D-tyrosyl-tRNA(Tyr) deacylase